MSNGEGKAIAPLGESENGIRFDTDLSVSYL